MDELINVPFSARELGRSARITGTSVVTKGGLLLDLWVDRPTTVSVVAGFRTIGRLRASNPTDSLVRDLP